MNPLVSVVVTTRNNHQTLDACLNSIIGQTYEPIELIIVDRDSTDGTKAIAKYYTNKVFNCGPERSAQRNFAVNRASGEFVMIVDSDMELTPHTVHDCVDTMHYRPATRGIIVPEESFGRGFWAACKRLERSFYHGSDALEAARFFTRSAYLHAGGYDVNLVSGEDWDLSDRVRQLGPIERVNARIRHNEGRLRLLGSLTKKFYYARKARAYTGKSPRPGIGPLSRYRLFLSRPDRLFKNPFLGLGMLFMKTCEFGVGAAGYLLPIKPKKEQLWPRTN
jgi:glycosyltransferase involved in cell wall biosynthesis